MKITVKELDDAFKYIIKRLIASGLEELDLDDEYWTVCTGGRFEMAPPKSLGLGSIIDDWNSLKKNIRNKEVGSIDIERFANVLIAMTEKIDKSGEMLIFESSES